MNVDRNSGSRAGDCSSLTRVGQSDVEESSLHELWKHPRAPRPPIWRFLNRICQPLHFVLDRILYVAHRGLLGQAKPLAPDALDGPRFVKIILYLTIPSMVRRVRDEMPELSEEGRQVRLALLDYVKRDVLARAEACRERAIHLDNYRPYSPPIENRPRWLPDPQVVACLSYVQRWVEQNHSAENLPSDFSLPDVNFTARQLGDLAIGLAILDLYFNLRMIEIEVREEIDQFHRANGLIKLALVMALATPFVGRSWISRLPTLSLGLISLIGAIKTWVPDLKATAPKTSNRCKISMTATNLASAIDMRELDLRRPLPEGPRPFFEGGPTSEACSETELEEVDVPIAELARRLQEVKCELDRLHAAEHRSIADFRRAQRTLRVLERQIQERLRPNSTS